MEITVNEPIVKSVPFSQIPVGLAFQIDYADPKSEDGFYLKITNNSAYSLRTKVVYDYPKYFPTGRYNVYELESVTLRKVII